MRVFYDLDSLPGFRNAVVTTGSFDGVHIGHQKVFTRIRELADGYGGESVVITFDPHPRQVIYPQDDSLRLLTSTPEKLDYLRDNGVDNVVVLEFSVEFSRQSAREYVEKFLVDRFKPKCLVVGYDHRFGLNREGNYDLLKEYEAEGVFDLRQIGAQDVQNITVSSTKIRNALLEGNIDLANQLLGRPYSIRGNVIHGMKIGTSIGYPTANVQPDLKIKLLPADGVYAARIELDDVWYPGMLYIGERPSVAETRGTSIEVNIFDFKGDLYHEKIRLDILTRLRDDAKFDSLEDLRKAIQQDEKAIKDFFLQSRAKSQAAIVALNYNGERVIREYLPSFKDNNDNAEVVIADNGSTDNSIEILKRDFPEFRLLALKTNTGYAGGYNNALKQVDAKYYALVNTDIRLTPGWLDPLIQRLENDPTCAAVQPKILDAKDPQKFEYAGGAGGFMDSLGYPFCAGRILHHIETDESQYNDTREIFWASGAAFVIRSDVFHGLGGFDERYFAHMEEIDMCWRVKRAGYSIQYIPDSTVYHEGGATLPYKSARKVFLNFRNNNITLIKNNSFLTLAFLLPLRLVLDVLAAIHFAVQGELTSAWSVIRAYGASIWMLPSTLSRRRNDKRRIESIRIAKASTTGKLRGSLLWQVYVKGKRKASQFEVS